MEIRACARMVVVSEERKKLVQDITKSELTGLATNCIWGDERENEELKMVT